MTPESHFSLGIDLAQGSLEAAIARGLDDMGRLTALPSLRLELAPDCPEALSQLRDWIALNAPAQTCARVVVESTGAISSRFARALAAAIPALPPASIVNPVRPKAFGKSLGLRSKNDRVDAAVLALFGVVHRPPPTAQLAPAHALLRDLDRLRQSLVEERTAWQNRLAQCAQDALAGHIKQMIRAAERQIEAVEARMDQAVEADPVLRAQCEAIDRIKGIGRITARTILAELGDLRQYGRNQIVARAGLFPVEAVSGQTVLRRPRLAKGGGGRLRRVLYNCAESLFRSAGPLRRYIDRLRERGKNNMQIIGAVMRKLLLIARAVVRQREIALRQSLGASDAKRSRVMAPVSSPDCIGE